MTMFSVKSTRLLLLAIVLAMTLGLAMCSTTTPAVTTTSPPKMTRQQKVASVTHSDKDIAFNTIPGASDQYVPEQHSSNRSTSTSQLLNFEANSNTSSVLANTTNSQANVFEATAQANLSHPDPLQVNAQQQNPFLSNVPGGINPQIAMMLQNNPRLQMLARQNPIVAQQIMRNPQLLRDPQIQRSFSVFLTQCGASSCNVDNLQFELLQEPFSRRWAPVKVSPCWDDLARAVF